MKKFAGFLFTCFILHSSSLKSQETGSDPIDFKIQKIEAPLSVSAESLFESKTVFDLNRFFKAEWIKEFKSVVITTKLNGQSLQEKSYDEHLTEKQLSNLLAHDEGAEIEIVAHYLPNNNLISNDIKKFDFKFLVNPENDARYATGESQLRSYLKDKIIDQINLENLNPKDLIAVKFAIDKNGCPINIKVLHSSKSESTDGCIVDALSKMTCWKAAHYNTGVTVNQEHVFLLGNLESCLINLFQSPPL